MTQGPMRDESELDALLRLSLSFANDVSMACAYADANADAKVLVQSQMERAEKASQSLFEYLGRAYDISRMTGDHA